MAGLPPQGAGIEQLKQRRCIAHAHREAVCRCPQCRQFFCRECVTEHGGQFLCSPCLQRLSFPDGTRRERGRNWVGPAVLPFLGVGALLFAWSFFYFLGSLLFALSASAANRGH